jgi:hypothetical protein
LWGRNTVRNRIKTWYKKAKKQETMLDFIRTTPEMEQVRKKYTTEFLKNNHIVFDGSSNDAVEVLGKQKLETTVRLNGKGTKGKGKASTMGKGKASSLRRGLKRKVAAKTAKGMKKKVAAKMAKATILKVITYSIKNDDLVVVHPLNSDTGLAYKDDNETEPTFVLLSRKEALKINKDGTEVCKAMGNVIKNHRGLTRGKSKHVFSSNKYCCVGAKPRRSAVGVEPGHYKMEYGVESRDWDGVVKAIKKCEHAFDNIAGSDVIGRIREARKVVDWERGKLSTGGEARIFNGVAFGLNLHLRAHIDHDFTYSLIQPHVDGVQYGLDDPVVCYFCFPKKGIAVPLRAGDFLLINALEYHCVSSRCDPSMDVFCLSSYLKTAVVGGNDNSRGLDDEESKGLNVYDNILVKDKTKTKKK